MNTYQQIIKTTGLPSADPTLWMPSQKEMDFISKVYDDFVNDYSNKSQGWQVLNNRSLETFWDNSNYDYNQIVEQDVNNPVVQYSSGITRDKANTLISALTQILVYPSVTAFNDKQEIDNIVSSIAKPILKYQYVNDGRPSESGRIKNFRYTHKQVVEGTVHILDTIDANGRLTSSIIPNEEVFIQNFFQPDVQLQGHFMHVRQWAAYAEVEAEFGDLDNFKYVTPGSLGWLNQTSAFKERYKALSYQDQCSVVKCWYPVKDSEVARLKKIGKLPKTAKKAKYFNVIINGVNMFPYDNLMPYYHGDYPVTKAVFENFSPAEFYWGNSMPNKCAQDKRFRDGWLTLMRYAAKLQAIPALLNFTGQHIENDVIVPGIMTDLPGNIDPSKIVAVPGTDKGLTSGMVQMMQLTDGEVDRATVAPMTGGQSQGAPHQVRTAMLINQNAQEILKGLAQQMAYREEARAFPILKASFQFLTRQKIAKLSIPNETFKDGTTGTLEVIFEKLPDMTEEEKLAHSYLIRAKEQAANQLGHGLRQVYVDPEYIQNLEFYCEAVAEDFPNSSSAFKQLQAEHKWGVYSAAPPGLFNIKRAAIELATGLGDNPKEMVNETPAQAPGQPPQQGQPPQSPQLQNLRQQAGNGLANLNTQTL